MRLPFGPVEIGPCSSVGTGAARARLLADEAEVADEHRLRRVGEVEHLRHAARAPVRRRPRRGRRCRCRTPTSSCACPSACRRRRRWREGFSGAVTSHTSCARLPKVRSRYTLDLSAFGQVGAVADAHHLRAAGFALRPARPECARGSAGLRGSVTSTIEVPLSSVAAGQRVHGLAAVVADVCDPAPALLWIDRLVGAARLQRLVAEQRHVRSARAVLRDCRTGESSQSEEREQSH